LFDTAARRPALSDAIGVRLADVLPPSVVYPLDVELDDLVIVVDQVAGCRSHSVECVRGFVSPAPHHELVVPSAR